MVEESELEPLRPWLENQLESISDADPKVLCDYILALLKHNVSVDELTKLCNEQLEDFLYDSM
jgi:RNA-binding protein 26